MKYTILGFQQEKLISHGLKVDDALLLRTIKDMYSSASMEFIIHKGKSYMWVNQTYLINQIPIIGTKRTLRNKLKELEEKGLIERILKRERNGQKGSFSYIAPTIALDSLQDYDQVALGKDFLPSGENSSYPLGKDFLGARKNIPNKDTSIRDTSIKDKRTISSTQKNILTSKMKNQVIERWNQLDLMQLRGINNNTKRYNMLKARIEEFGLNDVLEAIDEIEKSSFLKGQNDRGWTITFDWMIRPNNFIKVLEGNYRDKEVVKNERDSKEDDFDFGISI